MEPHSKSIEDWFSLIRQSHIVLPRFQRHEAWNRNQVVGLLENILRKPALPIGAMLTLEIGSEEPFHRRPIVGAPAPKPDETPKMHLLDGQQRLTALWRSLTGDYEDIKLFVSIELDQSTQEDKVADRTVVNAPQVEGVKRWSRKDILQPVWADNPHETYKRNLIPATVLQPGSDGENIRNKWLKDINISSEETLILDRKINELRERIAHYRIPFLSLDSQTDRETALDVFIKMNTSASPLKDFDIVVAQMEEATGESLHDKVKELLEIAPNGKKYGRIEDIILAAAALIIGKPPLKKTYMEKSFGGDLERAWPHLTRGFKRGLSFLHQEKLFNEKIIPTDVIVHLVCALWAKVPEDDIDAEGNADVLIRKALWRACYTNRYGKTSATRTYADYRSLVRLIENPHDDVRCELFGEDLPEKGELLLAGWPGRKDRLPRAILATALRAGGYDFASGAPAQPDNTTKREYHHLYPVGILGGNREDERANRALNCALINWKTNRKIGAKTPHEYIAQRAEVAKLGEAAVRQRLESHLIPYDILIAGDYENFLDARAVKIEDHMKALCEGRIPE